MKKLLLAFAILTMVGCEAETKQMGGYIMPPELEGCKVFKLSSGGSSIRVVSCPTKDCTSQSYQNGKVKNYTAVCQ